MLSEESMSEAGRLAETKVVPQTSAQEMERIMAEQTKELGWYKDVQSMKTTEDLRRQVESGYASVVSKAGDGYKISANVPEEFRVLRNDAGKLLEQVCQRWIRDVHQLGLDTSMFLVVSSLARTEAYQKILRDKGYPAAKQSTHTKLGAFDIGIKWLKENKSELLHVLDGVLQPLKDEGRINWITEHEIGAYHIALNPHFHDNKK